MSGKPTSNSPIQNTSKVVYPLPTGNQVSSFGVPKVVQPEGLWAHKNVMGRGQTVMNEYFVGQTLTLTGVTGTFQVAEEIRGSVSLYSGTVTAINGDVLTITTEFVDWDTTTPEVITGQTSGATGNLASVGGARLQYNANESSVSLIIDGDGQRVVRQSIRPIAYVPGNGQVFKGTCTTDQPTTVSIVRRDSTSGSFKEKSYVQGTWNIDNVDGSKVAGVGRNPSEFDLDTTKRNIYSIDMEWLAVGRARWGYDFDGQWLIAHEERHANRAIIYDDATSDNGNRPYMSTATLPVTYEIERTGGETIYRIGYHNGNDGLLFKMVDDTGTGTTFKEFCHSVESDGGYVLPGLEFSTSISGVGQSISARTPILGIRLKSTFAGKDNARIIRFLATSYFATQNDTFFEFAHIHHPLDLTGTWISASEGSAVEYSTDLTFAGRPEHIVDTSDISAAGGSKGGNSASITSEGVNQHSFLAKDFVGQDSQLFVVYATPHTGTATVKANMTWIEFD